MPIECIIEDQRWNRLAFEMLVAKSVKATLMHQKLDPTYWEVSVLACNDARISDLNASFRAKNAATNVLSFPSAERAADGPGHVPSPPEDGPELGDIAISFDTCQTEAQAQNADFEDHVMHLIVHGTLHLLGYDHEHDADADLMESLEIAILAKLGVSDPYI